MYSRNDTPKGGFPHSDIHGSKPARGSPWLFAACHVLHRLLVPRHPPNALIVLGSGTRPSEEEPVRHAWKPPSGLAGTEPIGSFLLFGTEPGPRPFLEENGIDPDLQRNASDRSSSDHGGYRRGYPRKHFPGQTSAGATGRFRHRSANSIARAQRRTRT